MRNMLALFGAALLTVVGAGWYLGWYKVRSQPASVPGQHSVNIDIDTNKIGKDIKKGKEELRQVLENKAGEGAQKAGDGLTLPSPSSASQLNMQTGDGSSLQLQGGSDKGTPLFQFHSENGPSLQIGGDMKHPLIQIGSDKK